LSNGNGRDPRWKNESRRKTNVGRRTRNSARMARASGDSLP
jgi:hypothetical protein